MVNWIPGGDDNAIKLQIPDIPKSSVAGLKIYLKNDVNIITIQQL